MASVSFDFSGKTVLITGASRGIGLGVALGFARAGATLHILAETGAIHDAAGLLRGETGADVTGHVCDITERAEVGAVIGSLPALDVLVNNAGLERPTPILDQGAEVEATFRKIIDINVLGTYAVSREAVPKMGPGGRIVVTASIWGQTAVAEMAAYVSSKHANIGFMRTLARELGPQGITVNAVCPGWVRTEGAMNSLRYMAARENRNADDLLAEIVAAQALPDLMEPEDMIGPYLFLASEAAANITGQTLNVDRGEVMG